TIPKNPQEPPQRSGNSGNSEIPPHREGVAKEKKSGRKGNSKISKGNSQFSEGTPSPERLRLLRHHLHLRSQGWIQDPSGNWVKDENVEFDSDEEEPPPLPPA
ncbi:SCNM1 protein, partial [Zosterops hypoxanthus]|nr:SCNM1 protein [Zosterops hypoxanthus]